MSDVLKITLSEDFKNTVQQILEAETNKFSELTKISGLNLAEDFVAIDLSGADLSNDTLIGANFSYANLSGANLSGTDIRSANLSNADLSHANLQEITLCDATLNNTILSHANLSYADLRGADLRGADFSNANLRAADFREADLTDALLEDADVRHAQFQNNPHLSKAQEKALKQKGATFGDQFIGIDGGIDGRLKQLAIEAQRHPPKSLPRQEALAALLIAIQQSGKLVRPRQGQFQGFYEDIYAEALQRLFAFICEQIDRYDPSKEVLQWSNFLLRQRFFIEASREILPLVQNGNRQARQTLLDLDWNHLSETPPQPSLSEEIKQCLEEDPEGVFQVTHVANQPKVNFEFLAIQRISGYTWEETSAEVGIKVPSLSSFYERSLAKFAPAIRRYLSQ